ncbi:uncharacterized protein LOC132033580 [Lycium ferocissimum]|uniref:uncharacterized protein LOC132033580 n=1 Tax=Lycium ferocissimum TaxID=112874 RepID=UPI0028165635|nr:uncharacterized protein LOC132033580 [Lycium ferocissimum]
MEKFVRKRTECWGSASGPIFGGTGSLYNPSICRTLLTRQWLVRVELTMQKEVVIHLLRHFRHTWLVLVSVSSEAAEKELIWLGAVKHILELFFEYPYNNFLHHHVETIIVSCLESENSQFVEHLLGDCNLLVKIVEAEKNSTLVADRSKPSPKQTSNSTSFLDQLDI